MKKLLILHCVSIFSCWFSQNLAVPKYILSLDLNEIKLEKTDNLSFDYHKVHYIGYLKNEIRINYVDENTYNPLIKENYRSNNSDSLKKKFNKHEYHNVKIIVDTSQTTPLIKTFSDTSGISDQELDSINNGLKEMKNFPEIINYYDGFPVTVLNLGEEEEIIGFGNNVALELEVLNKEELWQNILKITKYVCGVGIKYFVLKPQQIATVFEPRLKGNYKTKFRYRLGNVVSNEFEGNIDDTYLTEKKP